MPAYTFPWDAGEYTRAVAAIGRHMRTGRAMQVFWWVVILVFGLSVAIILARADDPVAALVPITPWLLLFLASMATGRWVLPRLHARRFARESPDARHPLTVGVGAEGIEVASFSSSGRLSWNGIHRVVETPEFFLFYINPRLAHYLPKHAISSEDELGQVRRIARLHATGPVLLLDSASDRR
jgi:hypothetical protein